MAFTRKQLRLEIRNRIEAGEAKQSVYDELANRSENRNELAEILSGIPSLVRRKANKTLYVCLLALLGIATVLDFSMAAYWVVFYDLLLLYVVLTYRIRYFGWVWFRAILSFFIFLVIFVLRFLYEKDLGSLPLAGIVFALLIPTAFIAYKLENRLTTDFLVKGERYIDNDGHEKTRVYHEFRE